MLLPACVCVFMSVCLSARVCVRVCMRSVRRKPPVRHPPSRPRHTSLSPTPAWCASRAADAPATAPAACGTRLTVLAACPAAAGRASQAAPSASLVPHVLARCLGTTGRHDCSRRCCVAMHHLVACSPLTSARGWSLCGCSSAGNTACTYRATGPVYKPQTWYNCSTCGLTGGEGVCKPCAETCHRGHALSAEKTSSGFYCDCSAKGLCWQLGRGKSSGTSRVLSCSRGGSVGLPFWLFACGSTVDARLLDGLFLLPLACALSPLSPNARS